MSVFEKNDRRITMMASKTVANDIIKAVEMFDTSYSRYLTECHRFYKFFVNQAKEQGIKDKNIGDFLEYCMENEMTDTHIALMVQNYQDRLEAEEK